MKNELLKNIEIMAAEQGRISGAFVEFSWYFDEYKISFEYDHSRASSSWVRTCELSNARRFAKEDEVIKALDLDHVEHGTSDNNLDKSELQKNIEAFLGSVERKLEEEPELDGDDEHYDGQIEGARYALLEVRKCLKNILAIEDAREVKECQK